jgi:hypothetical protein
MLNETNSLDAGVQTAEMRLQRAEGAVARANAGSGGRVTDAAMAQTAQAAIFDEALLAAMHARFAELKAVTK